MNLPTFDHRLLLREVYESGIKDIMTLFDACLNLCGKAYFSHYWECAEACHKHFNVRAPFTAEGG